MSQLILIRHSVSQPVADKSAHRWTLTDTGRERCQILATHLKPYQPRIIYSSAELKARLTAELVAQQLNIPFDVAPDLRETRRENVPFFDNVADFEMAVKAGFHRPHEVVFGEESFADAHRRFARQIHTLLTAHPNETIAVVTHGTVLSLYLSELIISNKVKSTWAETAIALWDEWGMPGYAVLSLPGKRVVEMVPDVSKA